MTPRSSIASYRVGFNFNLTEENNTVLKIMINDRDVNCFQLCSFSSHGFQVMVLPSSVK